VEETVAGKRKS